MIKHDFETTLQADDITKEQVTNYQQFLDANNLKPAVDEFSGKYLYVANTVGEDDSLAVLIKIVDWLEQQGIAYELWNVNNTTNFKHEINSTILKNTWSRNKEIDEAIDPEFDWD